MPTQWTDHLATGIEEIDAQHRELYASVSQLHDALRYGEFGRAIVTLDFLERYVRDHFAAEEELMRAGKYPRRARHVALHRSFVREFLSRKQRFLTSGPQPSAVIDLADWLESWLRHHVAQVDRQLAEFLHPHG
jgi:hemerythrin